MHKLGDLKVPFQKQKKKNLKVEKRQDSTASGCRACLVAGRCAPRHACGCHGDKAGVWLALVGCGRRTRRSLWRPPVPWLLFGSCQIYGCHGVLQHKSTPQLWRPNSSPNLRRRRRRSVASHARKAEGFGGATHAVAGFGCQPNV
jgi:hypothetical protein